MLTRTCGSAMTMWGPGVHKQTMNNGDQSMVIIIIIE